MTSVKNIAGMQPEQNASAPSQAHSANDARVTATFLQFDANKDGAVSAEELSSVLTLISPNVWTSSRIESFIYLADANGDGKLQLNEFGVIFDQTEATKSLGISESDVA